MSWPRVGFGVFLLLGIWPLTIYRFTVAKPAEIITKFPMTKEWFTPVANWMEGWFDWLAIEFGDVFKGVTGAIRAVLDGLEVVLVETPWPVVMLVIVVMAWRLAGPRIAIFTAAALTYLATFGLWEVSMVTVALLGAAAFLCLLFGIPLGIWFGKSSRAYAAALPVLDFMQTMPAFVYLIPIIAFFGTGKPPGVLATIIFAMPPVIRLTALGMRQVPGGTKEAAIAFGCTKWQLLRNVEIPLAMPSIMTGINQTILMCLSMVVIASPDRRRRVGGQHPGGATVRRQGAGHARRPRHPVLRHGDRPHYPGHVSSAHGKRLTGRRPGRVTLRRSPTSDS